jgi:dolichyl-phosphate-mannose--protein O-mannosyl transferase
MVPVPVLICFANGNDEALADFAVMVSVLVPTILYLSLFCLHFSILTKAGTHDALMTSQF